MSLFDLVSQSGVRRAVVLLRMKHFPNQHAHNFTFIAAGMPLFLHIPKSGGISISKALYGSPGGGHTA